MLLKKELFFITKTLHPDHTDVVRGTVAEWSEVLKWWNEINGNRKIPSSYTCLGNLSKNQTNLLKVFKSDHKSDCCL